MGIKATDNAEKQAKNIRGIATTRLLKLIYKLLFGH